MDEILKALANPLRRQILGLSQSTVSAHLAVLTRAGLVTTRRIGQWVFYQRAEAAIQAFLQRLAREL